MAKRSAGQTSTADLTRLYLTKLGQEARRLRQQRGITLKRLAQLSGLSDRFLIEVEKGKANPSVTSLVSLADALQTSLTDLLPGDSEIKTQN